MPFATSDGVHIHYEIEGGAPPLVLDVGYMGRRQDCSAKTWEWFKHSATTISSSCDPRGFGDSDKPHEPAAYAADQVAQEVVAVLDAVGIDTDHFWAIRVVQGWKR